MYPDVQDVSVWLGIAQLERSSVVGDIAVQLQYELLIFRRFLWLSPNISVTFIMVNIWGFWNPLYKVGSGRGIGGGAEIGQEEQGAIQ
jgi:hypothetical protein